MTMPWFSSMWIMLSKANSAPLPGLPPPVKAPPTLPDGFHHVSGTTVLRRVDYQQIVLAVGHLVVPPSASPWI